MKQKQRLTDYGLFRLLVITLVMLLPMGVWAQTDYGITVGGVAVTSDNASGVTGDNITGTVTYSSDDNSLTLSGATIAGNIVITSGTALNIKVSGQNVINAGEASAIQSQVAATSPTLSFTKVGTGDCSLELNSTGVTVISTGFTAPTYNNLALVDEGVDFPDYYSEYGLAYYDSQSQTNVPITSATITSYTTYGIIVSGEEVTNLNKDAILKNYFSNGRISFDGEHTLTLDNVNNTVFIGSNPFIQTSMDLTINIVGESDFDCGQSVFITRMDNDNNTYTVTFTTDATNPGMLTLQVGDEFVGFDKAFENGLSWKPDGYYDTSDLNAPVAWVARTQLFSGGDGTEDTPYLIGSTTDLKRLSSYFNQGLNKGSEFFKLTADLNCSGLSGFKPIGTGEHPFVGTFSGKKDNNENYKISNLTYDAAGGSDYVGLFCVIGNDNPGSVSNLILENCTFKNGKMYNGGIAGLLSNGTIKNCTVTSCHILSDDSAPSSGGIVGGLYGGSITDCTVDGSEIKATSVTNSSAGGIVGFITGTATVSGCQVAGTDDKPTTITCSVNYYDSGNNCAGGIAGKCDNDGISISNNKVLGNTTISSIDNYEEGSNTCAGALIGDYSAGALTGNYYYYSVTTSTTNDNGQISISGYDYRAIGNADNDIFADDGAVMYTKLVNIPGETGQGSVEGAETRYYREGADFKSEMYIAPGETTMFAVRCEDGYFPQTVQVTYGTPATTINPTLESISGSYYNYSFEMPDEEATISVTYANGTGYNLFIGDTQVTSTNADDVLGDGKVSFSVGGNVAVIYTLTLNGATITAPIKTGLDNLTFDIQGTNTITTNGVDCIDILSDSPSITFTSTSDPRGNLTLRNTNPEDICGGVIAGDFYDHITINKSVALLQPLGTYKLVSDTTHVAKFVPSYGLSIDDLPICEANTNDVYGDGKVSFNKDTHTLTLNNASIGGISTSLSELDIDVIGNNSISMNYTGAVIRNPEGLESVAITVKSTAETKGCLSMYLDSNNNSNSGGSSGFLDDGVSLTASDPLQISGDLTATYHAYIMISEPVDYDLYVGDVKVTAANASNITNDLNNQDRPRATFDAETNTLTLDGIYYYWYWESSKILVKSNISNLKVNLVGDNTVSVGGQKLFKYTGAGAETAPTITFLTEKTEGESSYGSLYVSGHTAINDIVEGYTITNEIDSEGETGWKVKAGDSSMTLYYLEMFGITISTTTGDVSITNENRKDVLNDGEGEETVQFDGVNTLLLNGASLTGITVGTNNNLPADGLVVNLKGANTIANSTYAVNYAGAANALPLTFTTNEKESGSLVYNKTTGTMTQVTEAFNGLTPIEYKDGLVGLLTSDTQATIKLVLGLVVGEVGEKTLNGDDTNGVGLGNDVDDIGAGQENIDGGGIVRNNILYTFGDGDGSKVEDGKNFVALTSHQAGVPADKLPGSPEFAQACKAITMLFPAGVHELAVDYRNGENSQLCMQIGQGEGSLIKLFPYEGGTNPGTDVNAIALSRPTHVFLFNQNTTTGSSRELTGPRAPGRKETHTTEIHGLKISSSSVEPTPEPALSPRMLKADDLVKTGNHITVNDLDIEGIDAHAFDAFAGDDVTYVDLTKTAIKDITINRHLVDDPFSTLPQNTFIYLPAGNTAGGVDVDHKDPNIVIGGVCEEMTLADDDKPFEVAKDFTAKKVEQARDYSEYIGKNCTVFLPFALDAEKVETLGSFYELKGAEGGTITMETVTSTEANVPYMFKPAVPTVSAEMVEVKKDIPAAPEKNDVQFIGTFEQQHILSDGSYDYFCFMAPTAIDDPNGGKFVRVTTSSMTVNPFRAYLKAPAGSTSRESLDLIIDGISTGIQNMKVGTEDNVYYDLSGRRVLYPTKGLYIVNGKKVVIK